MQNKLSHKFMSVLVVGTLVFSNYSALLSQVNAEALLDVSSFVEKQITKQKIRNFLDNSRAIKSYKSDMAFKVSIDDLSSDTTTSFNLDMDANSIMNFKNEGNEKFQFDLGVTGNVDGEAVDVSAQVRLVDETLYGRVDQLPSSLLAEEPNLSTLMGQWYSYQITNMPEIREFLRAANSGGYQTQISDADLDRFISFVQSNEVLGQMSTSNYTAPDGTNAKCMNFEWTNTELKAMVRKGLTIYDPSQLADFDAEADELFNSMDTTRFSVCAGDNLNKIYKMSFKSGFNHQEIAKVTIEFDQRSSDFNQDLNVVAPSGAISLESRFPQDIDSFEGGLEEAFDSLKVSQLNVCNNIGGDIFPDVTSSFSSYDAIKYAKDNGIVNGYSDGCYRPNTEITREQFIKIITRSMFDHTEIDSCTDVVFPDLGADSKFIRETCYAKKMGIIDGYSDQTLRGSQGITFGESSKIVANAYGITSSDEPVTGNKFETFMKGLEAKQAIPFSVHCTDQKVVRAEVTEMIYRVDAGVSNKTSMTFESVNACM